VTSQRTEILPRPALFSASYRKMYRRNQTLHWLWWRTPSGKPKQTKL